MIFPVCRVACYTLGWTHQNFTCWPTEDQQLSSRLAYQSQECPRKKLFKTIHLLSSLLAGGLRGASHMDKCMHTSILLSATNPPLKPEVPDS